METSLPASSALTVWTFGIVLGFKHAIEIDHVVAVSAIVSQHRNIWRSALIGLLWGVGHTVSLFMVGMLVLVFEMSIPKSVSNWFELLVAMMIVVLGSLGSVRAVQNRQDVRFQRDNHSGESHTHLQLYEGLGEQNDLKGSPSHMGDRIGFKPLIVGSIHGLAGSAALTLLILPQIESVLLGASYLLTFGLGSISAMLAMSILMGLPFALAWSNLGRRTLALQLGSAALSVIFGLWYAYQWSIS
jgi:sulfite exporter TauE/SafE